MRLYRIATPVVVACSALALLGLRTANAPGEQMKVFADSFLESLDADLKAKATVPYESEQRVAWHFIPMPTRKGLPLKEMNTAQQTAALRLVRAGLSEMGYDKASKIMLLENVLLELEGPASEGRRDSEKYYLTIFGTPSATEPWGFSFEGHHLSLNFSCRDGQLVDTTPQFFASNPAVIQNDVKGTLGKGTRVLRQEEELAFELINSLDEARASQATIAAEAPAEIRFAGEPQVTLEEPQGIAMSELPEANQELLKQLISVYIDAVPEAIAKERRQIIDADGWDGIRFAWAGAVKPGIGHYYRIRGASFLIEFVNTQPDAAGNPANHIHCVWRDLTGDFDLPNKS